MQKCFSFLGSIILFVVCSGPTKNNPGSKKLNKEFAVYSISVRNSFIISIQLPEDYYRNEKTKYPVVYALDASFHFPILAATVKQYEKADLLPAVILVGIGYKSFQLMDSLRVRDYLYPAALPSDEINATGGGMKFYDFITAQLVPYIDSIYKTDRTNRTLSGHSFGGYFVLYALLHQVLINKTVFRNFSAASPSLWYNNFYLNQLTSKLKDRINRDTLQIFLSVGGLEDSIWSILPVKKFAGTILAAGIDDINFQYGIYNDLEHMDVSAITFTKALQEFYKSGK